MTVSTIELDEDDRALLVGMYLHGGCIAFAEAVHRQTGWQPVVLSAGDDQLWHVGLRHPEGGIFDVRGRLTEAEFLAGPVAGTLEEVSMSCILKKHPQTQGQIERAQRHAFLLFPDLPGRGEAMRPVDEFLVELADLCRRHEVFLRADGPHGIILYSSPGSDELGFGATVQLDGSLRIQRLLAAPAATGKMGLSLG